MSFDLLGAPRRFRDDGFAILEGGLDHTAVAELIARLAPFEDGRPRGRNDFEGEPQQVRSLVDHVLPPARYRQWTLSVPWWLRPARATASSCRPR